MGSFVWIRELFKKWILRIFLLEPSTNLNKRGRRDVFVYL